jgi:hypothetical protein
MIISNLLELDEEQLKKIHFQPIFLIATTFLFPTLHFSDFDIWQYSFIQRH